MGFIKSPATAPSAPPVGLSNALFTGTQQRLLALLFGQAERSFYANEIIGLAGMGSGAVQRELTKLSQCGLISVRAIGNQKHYQANAQSPIFAEIQGIVQKTFGLAEPLRASLDALSNKIIAAFVYGSVAKKSDTSASDIDLWVLSDHLTYADLYAALEQASQSLGRNVNPNIVTRRALAKRVAAAEAFTTRVLAQPKIWIIGNEHALAT